MSQSVPLISYLDRVRQAFTALTDARAELFTDWQEAWAPHARAEDDDSPGARLGPNGLLHAVALMELYCGQSVENVRAGIAGLRGRDCAPEMAAERLLAGIVGQAYEGPDGRPDPGEWSRNRMLKTLTLRVGDRFLLECLHGWTREAANTPALRAHQDRGYVYSCFVPPDEGLLSQGTALQHAMNQDEEAQTRLGPKTLMQFVRGLRGLADDEDRLGRAVIAVMHYGMARQCSAQDIADVMTLVVEIESA